MADAKKKTKPESKPKKGEKGEKAAASSAVAKVPLSAEVAAVESGNVHSPWIPLIWILVPLVACVVYGVLTRSQGH
jgi:hypothetical protein